ncbi:hypothetical protein Tco_1132129 [Tanacetum coccineum]|uniref:Uncharacterized protein n=1 Tax=Tanacetum coccineum TaxID=301880 RepID=A0ABQ5JE10_9ASTR
MATMAENIIAAGAENRLPILEKGMYNRWKTHILLYIKGKENGDIQRGVDAKEVLEMRQRFLDPLALVANTYNQPPSYNNKRSHYEPPVVSQQPLTLPTQANFRFVVPSFLPTDDPIASINKVVLFLSSDISSRYPPTNNQLRTSSNPRTQAPIQNGQFTVQNVQGRQSQGYAVNTGKSHMAKRCTAKKRVKDLEWFKEKMLLAQAQEAGVVLYEDQQDFLADKLEENEDCDDLQLQTTSNFREDHVDAYDSDCDDEATASAIFMASLSPAGSLNGDTVAPTHNSDILSKVPHYDTYHDNDVINSVVQETKYNDHLASNNDSYDELTSDINVISYADYMVTIEYDAYQYVPPIA